MREPRLPVGAASDPLCGDADVIAEVPASAREVAAAGPRVGWIEGDGELVVLDHGERTMVSSHVTAVAGSDTMFAFAFDDGGIGTYGTSVSLHPSARAEKVAINGGNIGWVDLDRHVQRSPLDGERTEVARDVLPVFALDGGSTWYVTPGADVHRDDVVVASGLTGTPLKMFAEKDHGWIGLADRVAVVGASIPYPIDVWQGPYVDFAADEREVVVALDHAFVRMAGGDTREVSIGACTVKSMTMSAQRVFALVTTADGPRLISIAR